MQGTSKKLTLSRETIRALASAGVTSEGDEAYPQTFGCGWTPVGYCGTINNCPSSNKCTGGSCDCTTPYCA